MVLNRGGALQGGVNRFQREHEPYAFCSMESLINKLTNKYICLKNLFIIRGGLKQKLIT